MMNSHDFKFKNMSSKTDIKGLTCNTDSMQWEWTDGSALDYKPPTYYSGRRLATKNLRIFVFQPSMETAQQAGAGVFEMMATGFMVSHIAITQPIAST